MQIKHSNRTLRSVHKILWMPRLVHYCMVFDTGTRYLTRDLTKSWFFLFKKTIIFCLDFTWKRVVFRLLTNLVLLFVAETIPNFGSILVKLCLYVFRSITVSPLGSYLSFFGGMFKFLASSFRTHYFHCCIRVSRS